MAWLLVKMAWLLYFLVQLHKFWTTNTLICAKWQHLEHGHFVLFQGQQLSYIVLDI
jgi:isoprenylcysteine carboxyl methyltransferase (ICMT) family protein YpbQ